MIRRTITAPSIPVAKVPTPCKTHLIEKIISGNSYNPSTNPDPFPSYTFNTLNCNTVLSEDGEDNNNENNKNTPPTDISGFTFNGHHRHIHTTFRPHIVSDECQSISTENRCTNYSSELLEAVSPCTKIEGGAPYNHKPIFLSLPSSPHTISSTTAINPSTTTLVDAPRVHQLQDFLIIEKLGSGASGTVYKAKSQLTSSILALKVIRKNNLSLSQLEDVVSEQVALRRMDGHLGFLQLESSFHDSENFYLATVSKLLLAFHNPLRYF
jgi:hypothetical protein